MPTVGTVEAYGPTASHDYVGFTLNGVGGSLLNSSAQGVGVGNNGIADGEGLKIVFDAPMNAVTLGINHIGNGEMAIDWIAYGPDGTTQVASGTTTSFTSDGSVTITPCRSVLEHPAHGRRAGGPEPAAPHHQHRRRDRGHDSARESQLRGYRQRRRWRCCVRYLCGHAC